LQLRTDSTCFGWDTHVHARPCTWFSVILKYALNYLCIQCLDIEMQARDRSKLTAATYIPQGGVCTVCNLYECTDGMLPSQQHVLGDHLHIHFV
jgi:hypothetical protein